MLTTRQSNCKASLNPKRPKPLGFVKELAAHMHHTGLLFGFIVPKQSIEARKAVRMHASLIASEMIDGMFALAVYAELIPRTGRGLPTPRAFVSNIAPEPSCVGLLGFEPALQLDWRVVCKKRGPRPVRGISSA